MGKMGVLSVWHFCQNWYLNHCTILTNATAVICCSVLIISDWGFQWQQAENLISWFKGWSSEFEESKQLCSILARRLPFSVWRCESEALMAPLIRRKTRDRLAGIRVDKPHRLCTWPVSEATLCLRNCCAGSQVGLRQTVAECRQKIGCSWERTANEHLLP